MHLTLGAQSFPSAFKAERKREKPLPVVHHLKELQDQQQLLRIQLAKFDVEHGLHDPNAPLELHVTKSSFRYGDDGTEYRFSGSGSVAGSLSTHQTALSRSTLLSSASSFRSYSQGQGVQQQPGDDDGTASASAASFSAVEKAVEVLKRIQISSPLRPLAPPLQHSYEKVNRLKSFVPFDEAYSDPSKQAVLRRERRALARFFGLFFCCT